MARKATTETEKARKARRTSSYTEVGEPRAIITNWYGSPVKWEVQLLKKKANDYSQEKYFVRINKYNGESKEEKVIMPAKLFGEFVPYIEGLLGQKLDALTSY